jgi:hypothetical protein
LLRQKAKLLSAKGVRVLTRNEPSNGNVWTLLIAQQSLISVIANASEEREQIEAIYNRLHEWLNCLFEDASIEKSLNSLKPMKSAIEPGEGPLRNVPAIDSGTAKGGGVNCRHLKEPVS